MAGSDFYNFDEALDHLRLKDEELKRLVSEGEIRAFREGDTMKLRREDVEHLKRELMGGEVVDLGGADEIVFEDDIPEAGMATEEISDMDTLLDEDVEEIEVGAASGRSSSGGAAAPAARPRPKAAVEEEATEGMGFLIAAIATTLVMILAMPIVLSHSKGTPSDFAKSIAGMVGQNFE